MVTGVAMSHWWFLALVVATGLARLFELRVAKRHEAWARQRGGVERGAGHYPVMVALHTAFLICCAAEVFAFDRPFLPWLGWPALVLVLASHGLRWWCIAALGNQWNTRVIVVPGLPLVTARGPYRWLRHPNYLAVVAEIAFLPLVHTAWATAVAFTVANLVLLRHRVRVEEAALEELAAA
jgi:methyltransferase